MRAVTALALTLALIVVGACGGTTESPSSPDLATPPPDVATPGEPTDEPTEATPEPSLEPTPEESFPTEPPLITPEPGSQVPAGSCSEDPDERDFYAQVVAAVEWAVYCPALPEGWHIDTGRYRTAGDGFLEISYEIRSGARLELSEGAFCSEPDGCVPPGEDVGAGAFGDLAGTLVAGDDGSWAIVVDRGAGISWLLVGRGMDEATFDDIASSLVRVEP